MAEDALRGVVLISSPVLTSELSSIAQETFGDMLKAVVDINLKIMVVGAELHSDEEAFLLDRGSPQTDLWGINIYLDLPRNEWIEFDSVINIRPSQGNRSRSVEDEMVRARIAEVVEGLVK